MARQAAGGVGSAVSRIAAATLGGLAFASAVIVALPAILPGSRIQLVIGTSMLGFALWTGGAIWAFGARSARHAWGGLILGTGAALALLWAAGGAAP